MYGQCAANCSHADLDCFIKCSDDYDENIPRCPCQSKCPRGCPCPEYECDRTEVLILNTLSSVNVPILTNASGREDKNFYFSIDEDAQLKYSCSLTWENELFVFGGDKIRQISKVTSCHLKPVGQLTFDHRVGDCVNVANNKVVLCFNVMNNADHKKCRMASSPTGVFSMMALSRYDHSHIKIATNDGKQLS